MTPDGRLHIGLVICGTPPAALPEFADGYLPMFGAILEPHGVDLEPLDAKAGRLTVEPDRFDGYLLTGSASSVYDPEPWIADAVAFVREVVDAGVPLAGVCFGHQLIAHALGGRVEKAEVGWGAGVHTYSAASPHPPTSPAPSPAADADAAVTTLRLQAMHQDQVLTAPDGAVVWATSEFCPIAGYTVGDSVWTVQGHPEFTAELSKGIIGLRAERFGPELTAQARATVDDPTDALVVGAAIAAFFRRAAARTPV